MLDNTGKGDLSARLQRQRKILDAAERTGAKLGSVLAAKGLSYHDLLYERSYEREWKGNRPLSLLDLRRDANQIPLVSFFTGCGGMDLGFEAAGFAHKAAFEINETFCRTIRQNRPQWKVFGPPNHVGDVSRIEAVSESLSTLISAPFEGVFIGGPPCQPFSIAANQRFAKWGKNFKRIGFNHAVNGNLLLSYVRIISEFRPAVFVIENVPGLRDLDDGRQLGAAMKLLEKEGYSIESPFALDAADYGIAQQRFRLFVVGTRIGGRFVHLTPSLTRIGCGSVLSERAPSGTNNETRSHNTGSIKRYMRLNYGARDKLGRVDRLDPVLPSKTVIAGGTNGGGRSHLHPEVPRTLSVRECARLQTFPDDYAFTGSTARQFTQVGNAVPPVLAAQLAIQIARSFF